jgi:hypothetical protein
MIEAPIHEELKVDKSEYDILKRNPIIRLLISNEAVIYCLIE